MAKSFCLKIIADLKNLPKIWDFVEQTATRLGLGPTVIYDLKLAVDEAVTNIIVHGYSNRGGDLEIEISREQDSLVTCLRDDAPPFDPTALPPPDLTRPLEERPVGGMGVHLIQQIMDEVVHRVRPTGGNELILKVKVDKNVKGAV